MKSFLLLGSICLGAFVAVAIVVAACSQPAVINDPAPIQLTPADVDAYQNTPEYKASVQVQLDEIRALSNKAIETEIKDGHQNVAYVHFKVYHKGLAIAIVVEEVKAKGWNVEKTFTESMLAVSAPKKK